MIAVCHSQFLWESPTCMGHHFWGSHHISCICTTAVRDAHANNSVIFTSRQTSTNIADPFPVPYRFVLCVGFLSLGKIMITEVSNRTKHSICRTPYCRPYRRLAAVEIDIFSKIGARFDCLALSFYSYKSTGEQICKTRAHFSFSIKELSFLLLLT